MKRQTIGFIGLAALVCLGGTVQGRAQESAAVTGTYKIDGVHSSVVFRATHLGVSYVYGRFDQIGGTIRYDASEPSNSKIAVQVQAASVSTGNEKRDNHLRSPDFLNAKQFPVIRFESTKVTETEDGRLKVQGELTLHGVTQTIETQMELVGHGDRGNRFGYRAGWITEFTIQRSEFGMSYLLDNNVVGDEIRLTVALEGQKSS